MQEKVTIQYLIGVGLALLTIPIVEGALAVLPNIGWQWPDSAGVLFFSWHQDPYFILLDRCEQRRKWSFRFY